MDWGGGGALREFLYLLVYNNYCLEQLSVSWQGDCLVPRHNVSELGKNMYYHIGVMLALSLIHGGPAPGFFTPAIVDYLIYGIGKVKATPEDVPNQKN